MSLSAFAGDGIDWAVARANCATGAGAVDDIVANESFANFSRAALFFDVGFIF